MSRSRKPKVEQGSKIKAHSTFIAISIFFALVCTASIFTLACIFSLYWFEGAANIDDIIAILKDVF